MLFRKPREGTGSPKKSKRERKRSQGRGHRDPKEPTGRQGKRGAWRPPWGTLEAPEIMSIVFGMMFSYPSIVWDGYAIICDVLLRLMLSPSPFIAIWWMLRKKTASLHWGLSQATRPIIGQSNDKEVNFLIQAYTKISCIFIVFSIFNSGYIIP